MNSIQNEIEIIKGELFLGRDTPALRERLANLLVDQATSFREEMAILARFDEAMREHPREYAESSEPRRCRRCERLVEPDSRGYCRGCEAEENSDARDAIYDRL